MKNTAEENRLMIVVWNMGIGGIQKRIRDVIQDISEHSNWKIYLVVRRHWDNEFTIATVSKVKILYYPFDKRLRMPLGFIFWLYYVYIQIRPAVLLTFLAQLSILMVFIRKLIFFIPCKIIINEGALTSEYLRINHMSYLNPLVRRFYPRADAIIVPTRVIAEELSSRYRVDRHTVHVIPNWTLYKAEPLLKKKYDIIYVGRYETEKNPQLFIDVVQALRMQGHAVRALMIGSGSLEQQLRARVTEAGLSAYIHFGSFQQDVSGLLRRSKILIVSSYNEGMPNVVLEAAMCRVPTVANNFKGAEEVIVHGKTGFITRNRKEMTAAIAALLRDRSLLRRTGANAQRHIQTHFSYARQKEFINVLLH